MSNGEESIQDEQKLRSLKAAAYISKSIAEGKSKEQIIQEFDGDRQMVDMLWSFAYHNRWFKKDASEHGYSLTKKGQERVSRLLKSFVVTSAYSVFYGTTMTSLEILAVDMVA